MKGSENLKMAVLGDKSLLLTPKGDFEIRSGLQTVEIKDGTFGPVPLAQVDQRYSSLADLPEEYREIGQRLLAVVS